MKNLIQKTPYAFMATLGFIIWAVETIAFGFNKTPESGWELLLDSASFLMVFWGILGDLASKLYVVKVDSPFPVKISTLLNVQGPSEIKGSNKRTSK